LPWYHPLFPRVRVRFFCPSPLSTSLFFFFHSLIGGPFSPPCFLVQCLSPTIPIFQFGDPLFLCFSNWRLQNHKPVEYPQFPRLHATFLFRSPQFWVIPFFLRSVLFLHVRAKFLHPLRLSFCFLSSLLPQLFPHQGAFACPSPLRFSPPTDRFPSTHLSIPPSHFFSTYPRVTPVESIFFFCPPPSPVSLPFAAPPGGFSGAPSAWVKHRSQWHQCSPRSFPLDGSSSPRPFVWMTTLFSPRFFFPPSPGRFVPSSPYPFFLFPEHIRYRPLS